MTTSSHDDPATMADLLEYLYGNESTAFGKQRIADGHEEPFKVSGLQLRMQFLTCIYGDLPFQVKYFELGEWT